MKCAEFDIPISSISHFMSFITFEKRYRIMGIAIQCKPSISTSFGMVSRKLGKTARYSDQIFKS